MGTMHGDTIIRGPRPLNVWSNIANIPLVHTGIGTKADVDALTVYAKAFAEGKADSAQTQLARERIAGLLLSANEHVKSGRIVAGDSYMHGTVDSLLYYITQLPDAAAIVNDVKARMQFTNAKTQYITYDEYLERGFTTAANAGSRPKLSGADTRDNALPEGTKSGFVFEDYFAKRLGQPAEMHKFNKLAIMQDIIAAAKMLGLPADPVLKTYRTGTATDILEGKALVGMLMAANEKVKAGFNPTAPFYPIFSDEEPTYGTILHELLNRIAQLPNGAAIVKEAEERTRFQEAGKQYKHPDIRKKQQAALDATATPQSGSGLVSLTGSDQWLDERVPALASKTKSGFALHDYFEIELAKHPAKATSVRSA